MITFKSMSVEIRLFFSSVSLYIITKTLKRTLQQLTALKYVTIQWVPSHVGIHRNEIANLLAKKRNYSVQKQPNTGSTAKTIIKN
jgi:hypothetical protein